MSPPCLYGDKMRTRLMYIPWSRIPSPALRNEAAWVISSWATRRKPPTPCPVHPGGENGLVDYHAAICHYGLREKILLMILQNTLMFLYFPFVLDIVQISTSYFSVTENISVPSSQRSHFSCRASMRAIHNILSQRFSIVEGRSKYFSSASILSLLNQPCGK